MAEPVQMTFTALEIQVLALLAGIGLSAFDVPGGPAYVLKERLEKRHKTLVTEQDIINLMSKIEHAATTTAAGQVNE